MSRLLRPSKWARSACMLRLGSSSSTSMSESLIHEWRLPASALVSVHVDVAALSRGDWWLLELRVDRCDEEVRVELSVELSESLLWLWLWLESRVVLVESFEILRF